MAGKGALSLVLAAGAAAVVLGGKKKKRKKKPTPTPDDAQLKWVPPHLEHAEEGGEKLVFDEECAAFADKLNYDEHNAYITGKFHSEIQSGNTNAREIVLAMLNDQAAKCPWGDPAAYTELMEAVAGQLLQAVQQYAADAGITLT